MIRAQHTLDAVLARTGKRFFSFLGVAHAPKYVRILEHGHYRVGHHLANYLLLTQFLNFMPSCPAA